MTKPHAKTTDLAVRKCITFAKGTPALTGIALGQFTRRLKGNWKVKGKKTLEKTFKFPDFLKALQFTNQVGKIAQKENHHPDIYLSYGEVRLQWSTHSVGGLSENDFILAAKVNQLK
jgi:4a-hydroxytetrahydrobiopterin dehydratase